MARKLALLVRPALVARPGKIFVWSDWSAIEARVTPWLAASEGAEKVLDIFRGNDADPTRPDIYMLAAADILHKKTERGLTKTERGIGKVQFFALGFGGSIGALTNMALSYPDSTSMTPRRVASSTPGGAPTPGRADSGAPSRRRSSGLWGAAMRAWETPGEITTADSDQLRYREDYLGGCPFMALPSGRL